MPSWLLFIHTRVGRLWHRHTRERVSAHLLLTRREREVAELVARGYTNREIAEALVIAPETVKTHIANIRAKVGIATKAELRHWLLEQDAAEKHSE